MTESKNSCSAEEVLARLQLSALEREILERQGFVTAEYRGRRGPYYKLRFRVGRRQVVRYLGSDGHWANQVQTALDWWQGPRQAQRALSRRIARERRVLRTTRAEIEPLAEAAGYYFHGYALRRRRRQQQAP